MVTTNRNQGEFLALQALWQSKKHAETHPEATEGTCHILTQPSFGDDEETMRIPMIPSPGHHVNWAHPLDPIA